MKKLLAASAILFALITSCNNQSSQEPEAGATEESVAPETATPQADIAEVTLNGGDDMKFDLSEIRVKEGQTVKLTLNHTGKMEKVAMGHNFVLLSQEASLDAFAAEAINAKDNDYIPSALANQVLAHTKTIGGGESDTIEFTAPAKGEYDFLCSFPGHSALMKGKFIVE